MPKGFDDGKDLLEACLKETWPVMSQRALVLRLEKGCCKVVEVLSWLSMDGETGWFHAGLG